MIHFEITKEKDTITKIMTHPSIWSCVTDDLTINSHYEPSTGLYVLAKDDEEILGLVIFQDLAGTCVQAHVAFLPSAWGKRTLQAIIQMTKWFFKNTTMEKIVGFIPECNVHMVSLANRAGFKTDGIISNCFWKNEKLHNLIIVSIGRN